MEQVITQSSISSYKKTGTKLWKKRLRRFANNKLALFGSIIVAIFVIAVLAAPLLTQYGPLEPDFGNNFASPSLDHPFGTDSMGRDMLARILYGGRVSILIAVSSSACGCIIGMILGAIGGYFGGLLDKFLVRLSELFMSFPQLILVMVVMAFIGPGTFNLILIFAITGWTGTFRLVRAEYIARKEETYVQVCDAFGMNKAAIMFKQIMPSVLTLVMIQFTMGIPGYVMSEAGLSFLGFGVPMTTPTWGTMLNAAKSIKIILYNSNVWLTPGLAISLFVLAVNFFGDGLRDAMDPRQQ
jgi:peptide/nickel transport system permease protein